MIRQQLEGDEAGMWLWEATPHLGLGLPLRDLLYKSNILPVATRHSPVSPSNRLAIYSFAGTSNGVGGPGGAGGAGGPGSGHGLGGEAAQKTTAANRDYDDDDEHNDKDESHDNKPNDLAEREQDKDKDKEQGQGRSRSRRRVLWSRRRRRMLVEGLRQVKSVQHKRHNREIPSDGRTVNGICRPRPWLPTPLPTATPPLPPTPPSQRRLQLVVGHRMSF